MIKQGDSKPNITEIPGDILEAVKLYKKKERKEQDDLEIRFWDFAGQQLYYTTHQVNIFIIYDKLR